MAIPTTEFSVHSVPSDVACRSWPAMQPAQLEESQRELTSAGRSPPPAPSSLPSRLIVRRRGAADRRGLRALGARIGRAPPRKRGADPRNLADALLRRKGRGEAVGLVVHPLSSPRRCRETVGAVACPRR